MGNVWQEDPFKAKWTIIAKSYSVIRDSLGKKNAPLNRFLAITCSLMAIIEPAQYFIIMGWEIATGEAGETIMRRREKPIDARYLTINYSVNDVIYYSHSQGYFTGNLLDFLIPENEASIAMAATMQPTRKGLNPRQAIDDIHDENAELPARDDTEGFEWHDGTPGILDFASGSKDEVVQNNHTHDAAPGVLQQIHDYEATLAAEDVEEAALTLESRAEAPMTGTVGRSGVQDQFILKSPSPSNLCMTNAIANPAVNPGLEEFFPGIKNDAHELQNGHFDVESEFPFNEEFDPANTSLSFDPFWGNQFDAFDISDWNDFVDFDQYP